MTTSRQPIIDIVELVANLIASASHLQELIENEEDLDKRDEYTNQLYELIDIRRGVMQQIECKDKNLRCSLKHAIGQRGFAIEIYYSSKDEFWKEVMVALTKHMYKTLSAYMGLEISDCSRCVMDAMANKKEDEGQPYK